MQRATPAAKRTFTLASIDYYPAIVGEDESIRACIIDKLPAACRQKESPRNSVGRVCLEGIRRKMVILLGCSLSRGFVFFSASQYYAGLEEDWGLWG